jgi:Mrp family chromosome partitioning ATPase
MQNLKDDWWWQEMRSEIPQLDVVTAIADSESEDYLSQLLFSQGWNIIFRAFDADSLHKFLSSRSSQLRTVVIYRSDLEGFDATLLEQLASNAMTLINLDQIKFNSHAIMTQIRQALRAPMVTARAEHAPASQSGQPARTISQGRPLSTPGVNANTPEDSQGKPGLMGFGEREVRQDRIVREDRNDHEERFQLNDRQNRNDRQERESTGIPTRQRDFRDDRRSYIVKKRRVISVTGSGGAPGRTRFALAIAQEIARSEQVLLVDADLRSQSLARQREQIRNPQIQVAPLDPRQRPTSLPGGERTVIVDLGTLPVLSEAVTDRRWQGSLINSVLDSSTHLVYLTKSTPSSIDELAQFLREFPVLLKSIPITYLCVLSGHSRALREWEAKFMTLTIGENRHIVRESQLESSSESSLLPFLKATNPNRKEIGKILASLI